MPGIIQSNQDKAALSAQLLDAALAPSSGPLTVVSGAAQQDQTGLPSEVYVAVTGAAAGTVAVAIGPTNACAIAIIPAADATVNRNIHFRLPAGWYFKVTVVAAAIASAVQVAGG